MLRVECRRLVYSSAYVSHIKRFEQITQHSKRENSTFNHVFLIIFQCQPAFPWSIHSCIVCDHIVEKGHVSGTRLTALV